MKKPYQIEAQRAVNRLEEMAAEGNPAVQMVLPMAEMVGWLRKGVGELVRQAGLQLMSLLMDEEVRELAGERSRPQPERTANRWGKERGYCVVMGQKVPIERPRVRTTEDKEVRLGSYEMFHRGEPLSETVWEKLMLGLSTRRYGQAVREFTEAYGLEKSAVSEHFIEASRVKLKDLMERRLNKLQLCALLIDATPFEGQQMIVALGIGQDGRKTILGIRQGATENATVVGELLGDLMNRGLDFSTPRLYVLDGGKALHAAVKKYAGESAPIQRCQVHKRRNVLDHLTDEQKPAVARKLNAAYALEEYAAAREALNGLHHELMHLNPSAARSLGEGLEETLTVHRLHVPQQLRLTLASTNVIESAFSIVERVCLNVKRWHSGDQRERWVGSGLLVAEKQFRRIKGHKQLPLLLRELEALIPCKSNLAQRRKAS
ncbi:MAG TPA: IS256 family transposase [Candidatus Acidoferrum sp.]|jgi:putative transposase|nr:IS256 family transposase [Candidatus Acidoferrum sp.]